MAAAESEENSLEDLVFTKYKLAGEIVNRALQRIIEKCLPEASVKQICEFGDAELKDETSKAYEQEIDVLKGVAFPTCVSVNHCICNFSPILNDPDVTLKEGDLGAIQI